MKIQNGMPVMTNSKFLENDHTMNKVDIEETCKSASKGLIIVHPLNYLLGYRHDSAAEFARVI